MATRVVPALPPVVRLASRHVNTQRGVEGGKKAATLTSARDRYVDRDDDTPGLFVESGVGVAVNNKAPEALSARDFLLGRARELSRKPESGLTLALWFQSLANGTNDPDTAGPLRAFRRDVAKSLVITLDSFSLLASRNDLANTDVQAFFAHAGRQMPVFEALNMAMREHLKDLHVFTGANNVALYVVGRAPDDSVCGLVSTAPSA